MKPQKLQVSQLISLDKNTIILHLRDFLGDDSKSDIDTNTIISHPEFQPDSFTILDRFFSPTFLDLDEQCEKTFVRNLIDSKISLMESNDFLIFDSPETAREFFFEQVMFFLHCFIDDVPIASLIYNQEFPDVVDRILAYCIFGDPKQDILLHQKFNQIALSFIPKVISDYMERIDDIKLVFKYSIASGLLGLDLKGAQCCASKYCQWGIPFTPLLSLTPDIAAQRIYSSLKVVSENRLAIDHWNLFLNEIRCRKQFYLLWLTDDFIETMFDLKLVSLLLDKFENLHITLVPKRGQHSNDASLEDVINFLSIPEFASLNRHLGDRLEIHTGGPRMGAINLRKLSPSLVRDIQTCDAIYVKGCRMHEMIQGGINKKTFTAFVVTREFSESETGFDGRLSPLVFIRLEPGEYAYWGFKGRKKRRKTFPDGREIRIVYSTTEEHERRKRESDPNILITELNRLMSLYDTLEREYRYAFDKETRLLVDRMIEITRQTYNKIADQYRAIRRENPSQKERKYMLKLLNMIRERVRAREGWRGADKITVLDVGAGHGRDIAFLSQFSDVIAIGVDNSEGFARILRKMEKEGKIPKNSFYQADMRDLAIFPDGSFDAVRHNATLLHLPMLPNRIGADEAVAESFRILRPLGVLYVLVKLGTGLAVTDTKEGLGPRIYQYYTPEMLKMLLERNGFRIIEMGRQHSQRPSGTIEWVYAYAEKPDGP